MKGIEVEILMHTSTEIKNMNINFTCGVGLGVGIGVGSAVGSWVGSAVGLK